MIVTDDVRRESTIKQQRDRFSWRSWTAVFRMRVLYETEAFCHRLEDGFLFFARFAHFKELSATLRPGLHTPSTQMEGPLVRDDAEVAPVLSFSFSFSLIYSLSFSLFVCLSLSLPVFSGPSPTLFAAVPVISSLARVGGLHLAPGTGASPLTLRAIRELPVSLLRGFVSKTTPRQ